MAGIDNLKARLNYRGGAAAEERFQRDKLETLKKALIHSYQGETITLADGRQFRCLINRDKLSEDYDDKIISIPYKNVRYNASKQYTLPQIKEEEIGMKVGDVFEWTRTGTHWLVTLQRLEEDAYFRADIRKCTAQMEIDGNYYWCYIRGPLETDLVWKEKSNIMWNENNYKMIAYIQKTPESEAYFHRFTKVKIDGNMWEVRAVNTYYGGGMIRVCLGEWFNNELDEEYQEQKQELIETKPIIVNNNISAKGPLTVYPYDIINYSIINASGGSWYIDTNKAKIVSSTDKDVIIEIITGKSGNFTLEYKKDNDSILTLPIVIDSL